MNEKKITFRMAEEKDAGLVMSFIHHLSVYEEMEGQMCIRDRGETYKGIGKEEINIESLPVLADKKGAIGSSTSDSERAMITEAATEVLTLIYSFSDNDDLEKAL